MRLFLFSLVLAVVAAQDTGFRMSFTESGLTQFEQTILALVNADFQNIPLPDINIQQSVPILGDVSVSITNIVINSFKIPAGAINVASPNSVAAAFENAYIQVDLNFEWRKVHWPHISDHGSLTATPQQGNLNLAVALTPDATGHVVVTPSNVAVDFDKLSLHFSGHWDSWLYNIFADLFSHTLRDALNSAVTTQLKSVLQNTLNTMLQKIPTTIEIGGTESRMDLGVGVTSLSAQSNSYIQIGLPVTVTDVATGAVCPLPPVSLPDCDPQANQIQFFLSQTPLDCALWVAYKNGALSPAPLHSNTADWLLIAPALPLKYPNANVSITLTPAALPAINISTQGVALGAGYYMNLTVEQPSGDVPSVLVFAVGAQVGLDVSVGPSVNAPTSESLFAKVTTLNAEFNVVSSEIGPVSTSGIQALLNIATPLIEASVNKALANGYPIPLAHGITLSSPQFLFFENYLAVAANIAFNP